MTPWLNMRYNISKITGVFCSNRQSNHWVYCQDVKLNITASEIFASLSCHLSSKLGGNLDGRGMLPVAVQRTTSSRRPRPVPDGLGANTPITTPRMVTSSHRISTLAAPAPTASTYSTTVPPRPGTATWSEWREKAGVGGRVWRTSSRRPSAVPEGRGSNTLYNVEDGDFQPPIQQPRRVHLQHHAPPCLGAAAWSNRGGGLGVGKIMELCRSGVHGVGKNRLTKGRSEGVDGVGKGQGKREFREKDTVVTHVVMCLYSCLVSAVSFFVREKLYRLFLKYKS
jgi:hypothetical protein